MLELICSDSAPLRSKSSEGVRNVGNTNLTTDTGFTSGSPTVPEQKWTEMTSETSPSTSSPRIIPPVLNSVQSLYAPALLSYDPIQTAPPGHKPLGLSPRPVQSKSQEETELSNNQNNTQLKLKPSNKRGVSIQDPSLPVGSLIQNLPIPDVGPLGYSLLL